MQTKIVVVVGRYPGEEEVRVRVRKAVLNDAADKVIRASYLRVTAPGLYCGLHSYPDRLRSIAPPTASTPAYDTDLGDFTDDPAASGQQKPQGGHARRYVGRRHHLLAELLSAVHLAIKRYRCLGIIHRPTSRRRRIAHCREGRPRCRNMKRYSPR